MEIHLDQLQFYAYHGVLPEERQVGGQYVLSLTMAIPDSLALEALQGDDLSATVNYAEAYEVVRAEMERPSALLEHVADRVAQTLLRRFAIVRRVDVDLTKVTPPIAGFDGAGARVSYSLHRRLVVWDFDGTIADTTAGIVRTMNATLSAHGLPEQCDEAIRQTIGLPLRDSIATLGGLEGAKLNDAVGTYHRLFEEIGAPATTLYPGIAEVVRAQKAVGMTLAIATSRGHKSVEALCRALAIHDCFDFFVAVEDVARAKPHPEAVNRLRRLANTDVEHTTVVGDTTYDIEMGRRAGVRTIGVGWGNHSEDELLEAGADFVVRNCEELLPKEGGFG